MTEFDALLREALLVTAILTLPILVLATLVGTVVAVVQAATQVQEQTLTLLPKIVAVGIALALFGNYGLRLCAGLLTDVLTRIPELVHGGLVKARCSRSPGAPDFSSVLPASRIRACRRCCARGSLCSLRSH